MQRENSEPVASRDLEDLEDEKPTVVVLKPGDLTAEEASKVEEQLKKGRNPHVFFYSATIKIPSCSTHDPIGFIYLENDGVERPFFAVYFSWRCLRLKTFGGNFKRANDVFLSPRSFKM